MQYTPYNKKIKRIYVLVFCTSLLTLFGFMIYQLTLFNNMFYKLSYTFTKVSAENISNFYLSKKVNYDLFSYSYTAYDISDYSLYQNRDVFVINPSYLNELKQHKAEKYKVIFFRDEEITKFSKAIIDSFNSVEFIESVSIIDKNGYVLYCSQDYVKNFIGNLNVDLKFNIENRIYSCFSNEMLKTSYIGNNIYKVNINDVTKTITLYPINVDSKLWGNVIVILDTQYLKDFGKSYRNKILCACFILLIVSLIFLKIQTGKNE